MWVSSISLKSSFPTDFKKWDLDKDKIRLFTEQIRGWQLDIARYLLIGDTNKSIPPHEHSAFGALSILVSYFENIARYIEGCENEKNPGDYFKKGVKYVYADSYIYIDDIVATLLYKQLRCGLYHVGLSTNKVTLSEDKKTGLFFADDRVYIAPIKFYNEVCSHFSSYIKSLGTNKKLRSNFGKRFDWTQFH